MELNIKSRALNNDQEVVEEKKEFVNYTREEYLEKFGYITGRLLTDEEIKKLPKVKIVMSRKKSEYNGKTVISYSFKAWFTNRLIVEINFSSAKDKFSKISESQFNTLAGILGCDIDHYDEFEFELPYRLFTGKGKKDNRTYYQYEIILAKSKSFSWIKRAFFRNEQIILIERHERFLQEFIVRHNEDELEFTDIEE